MGANHMLLQDECSVGAALLWRCSVHEHCLMCGEQLMLMDDVWLFLGADSQVCLPLQSLCKKSNFDIVLVFSNIRESDEKLCRTSPTCHSHTMVTGRPPAGHRHTPGIHLAYTLL